MIDRTIFEREKLNKQLAWFGFDHEFKQPIINEFNEPTDGEETILVKGIFHETKGFVTKNSTDAATVVSKPQPMVFCSYNQAKQLLPEAKLTIGQDTYKVVDVNDVSKMGVYAEISLELILK